MHTPAGTEHHQPDDGFSTTPPAPAAGRASFRRGVIFSGVGTAVTIGCLFLETVVATRLLEPAAFGTYLLLVIIVNFCVMAIDFGSRNAMTSLIAAGDAAQRAALTGSALLFRAAIVALVALLLWLAQALLLWFEPGTALWQVLGYAPIMFAVASFEELCFSILRGCQVYRRIATAETLRSVLRLLLSGGLLFFGSPTILALIASWTISFAASIAVQAGALPLKQRPRFCWAPLAEALRFGAPLQLTRFMLFAADQVETLVLIMLGGPATVAYFGVASRIPDGLQRLSEAYINVYFPAMATLFGSGRRQQAVAMLERSIRLISFGAASAALVAVVFSHEIIRLLFSPKYEPSAPALAILMMAFQAVTIAGLIGYTLTSAGFPTRSFYENLTRTLITLVGCLALTPWLGTIGPACALLVAGYVSLFVGPWMLRRSDIMARVGPHLRQTALLFGCALVVWLAQPQLLVYRLGLLLVFVALSLAFGSVSLGDLSTLLPQRTRRLSNVASMQE